MSSILKVDQLQDSGGNNLVTSNGSGVITAAGFGKIGQVVGATDTTEVNTTSTSFAQAGSLELDITPSSTTSKIYIVVNTGVFKATGGSGFCTIYRDSTNLGGAGGMSQYAQAAYDSTCITFLDSPATTSSVNYGLFFRSSDSNPFYVNSNNGGGLKCSITAMEVLP